MEHLCRSAGNRDIWTESYPISRKRIPKLEILCDLAMNAKIHYTRGGTIMDNEKEVIFFQ